MSLGLRIVLITGCAVLALLHGGRTGTVLAQGLEGPYDEEPEAELAATSAAAAAATTHFGRERRGM